MTTISLKIVKIVIFSGTAPKNQHRNKGPRSAKGPFKY